MRGLREGGGNCLKYLKRGWNRKKGRENKDFQKGGKLGQGVGALKRGRAENPLRTMFSNVYRIICNTGCPKKKTLHNFKPV